MTTEQKTNALLDAGYNVAHLDAETIAAWYDFYQSANELSRAAEKVINANTTTLSARIARLDGAREQFIEVMDAQVQKKAADAAPDPALRWHSKPFWGNEPFKPMEDVDAQATEQIINSFDRLRVIPNDVSNIVKGGGEYCIIFYNKPNMRVAKLPF